ncbi:retinoic acid-induced protein 2 [Synchiropus splendidus]|uniref:retinoic acid-induced protein 2 n=1 Tax=Synchiropus splendidus TaxID=270530 RepID=UPI00237E667A|nr:retinoic acid-induced protein 2 [Synchiropus splendidus]
MEGSADLNVAQPEAEAGVACEDGAANVRSGVHLDIKSDSCDGNTAGQSKGGLVVTPAPSVESPNVDSAASVPLKVSTAVLHPVCLGENPLMLPIHVQMAGAAAPQLGQLGAAPYVIASSQNPLSLPLVLDQQVLQQMNPSVIPQSNNCQQAHIMNPLTFSLPSAVDQKTDGQAQDVNLLSLLQNPAFAGLLQDLVSSQTGSPLYSLPSLAPPYTSPLAPLVPPATLLVPYPVIIPLPVPLPIPLPIPVPVLQTEDSKGNMPKPVCTVNTSTQTCPHDTTSPSGSSSRCPPSFQSHNMSSLPLVEGQALDLSLRTFPVQPKQENPSPQPDSALDLSVPCVRKKFPQQERGVAKSDSKLLASLEFSRQHKWMVDSVPCGSSSGGPQASLSRAGNLEICGSSQAAKVIVSVKEAIPAILCGKIKSLSGVSTKNFSIKRDGGQSSSLQQLYGVPAMSKAERHTANGPLNKVPKNRAIKVKKVSSQEIHFLPIKKQRLAALLPRK